MVRKCCAERSQARWVVFGLGSKDVFSPVNEVDLDTENSSGLSLTSSCLQNKHSGGKFQQQTFYEKNDVAAILIFLVLFHLPEDGGW